MNTEIEVATVPMRQFEVEDASGRRYRVTRYVWLENTAGEGESRLWRETKEVYLTDTGGWLEPLGERCFAIDGTETIVTTCTWSRPVPL